MPNVHYFGFDFSKFKRMPELSSTKGSGDVYNPVDKPSGTNNHPIGTKEIRALCSCRLNGDIRSMTKYKKITADYSPSCTPPYSVSNGPIRNINSK